MNSISLIALAASSLPAQANRGGEASDRPNFLIIQCDQLATRAVGAYDGVMGRVSFRGRTDVIDSLASRGVVFANAYTACPLSQPARTGLLTGLYPHQTGVRTNSGNHINRNVDASLPSLGKLFSEAGYNAVHFGKTHDMGALMGFTHKEPKKTVFKDADGYPVNQDSFKDVGTCRDAVSFLSNPGTQPFICMVDFQNPHNICGYVGTCPGPHEVADTAGLPPLPPNFEVRDWDAVPGTVQYICCNHRRQEQASHWTDLNYRQYIDAYLHYVDIVCAQIRQVLAALNSTPEGANTIVVMMADHGDSMASHRLVTKFSDFHEETVRVPLIMSGNGVRYSEKPVQELFQTTTDLVPTLCEMAGIPVPGSLPGISFASSVRGEKQRRSHDFVVSEWHSEYDRIVTPGRMVRSERFKYTHYLEGGDEELFDLLKDPYEMCNLARDPSYAKVLAAHRRILRKHVRRTGDDYFSLEVKVDPKFRDHAPGFSNHVDGTGLWNFCQPSKP